MFGDRSAQWSQVIAGARWQRPSAFCGARQTSGAWLLFLHADSRLPQTWAERIRSVLLSRSGIRLVSTPHRSWNADAEDSVQSEFWQPVAGKALRRPGFVHCSLYERCGGFADVPLMETSICGTSEPNRSPAPNAFPDHRWTSMGSM